MVKFPQKGFIRKNLILKLFFSFWTACQLKLCPVLRNRSDSMQFLPSRKQGAPRVHAAQLQAGRVISLRLESVSFRRKLTGRNCMDAISPRFPGFRSRSIAFGNPLARAPPIGRRLGFGVTSPQNHTYP